MNTAGEDLLGRELWKEKRAGVTHYVSGQLQAELSDDCTDEALADGRICARLTYVDAMGHACLFLCTHKDGEGWTPVAMARAGQVDAQGPLSVPNTFRLSEKMLAALNEAKEAGDGTTNPA